MIVKSLCGDGRRLKAKKRFNYVAFRALAAISFTFLVAACDGGGSSSPSPQPTPAPTPTPPPAPSPTPTAPEVSIVAVNAARAEGDSGTSVFSFSVERTGDLSSTSSVSFSVSGAADAADFVGGAPSGVVNFASGSASQPIEIDVAGDTVPEPDETFTVTISNPTNATIATASAGGTIQNDDFAPVGLAPASFSDAVRFLNRATFGATEADATNLMAIGYSAWVRDQINKPVVEQLPRLLAVGVQRGENFTSPNEPVISWQDFVERDDQLRQRMMFALSEILVVGDNTTGNLIGRSFSLGYLRDVFLRNAFGNYRDVIDEVTYSPAMAIYLTYLYNRKGDPTTNRLPDENYARELMQLFTIGLNELELDGALRLDGGGNPIPTYTTEDVQGLARVFTGFGLKGTGFGFNARDADAFYAPVQNYPDFHETGEKRFLDVTIPAGTNAQDSVEIVLDTLFQHPNVAPFIGRQLIQRFVTSAPSTGYVRRVATAFETGRFTLPDATSVGSGQRGDLAATIAAILLDQEALQSLDAAPPTFGKVKEPVMRFTQWARAFKVNSGNAEREDILEDTSAPSTFNQHPSRSPSVFNFFRPGYIAPGTSTGAAGLTAPELQITTAPALTGYAATMSLFIRDSRGRNNDQSSPAYIPDYSSELALADDPDALVTRLDDLLTGGAMQLETRQRIVQMMDFMAGDTDADRLARVRIAVWMVMTSPEFIVQR